jgi:hypothetical protein
VISRRAALPLVAAALAGCYRYVPVAPEAAPLGREVRVMVSRRGMAELPEELPTGGTFVAGRLVSVEADRLLLQVPVRRRAEDTSGLDLRQNLFLPISEIIEVRGRELSAGRSALAVAGAAGFGALVVLGILDAGGDAPPSGEESPDQLHSSPALAAR